MHPLPEFQYPLGGVFREGGGGPNPALCALGVCALAWLGMLLVWWHALGFAVPPPGSWLAALFLGLWLLLYAAWLLRRQTPGVLCWCVDHPQEPGYWAFRPAAVAASSGHGPVFNPSAQRPQSLTGLEWALDLQWAVLLRLEQPGQAPRWAWCLQGAAPARWASLRRALQFTQQQRTAAQ